MEISGSIGVSFSSSPDTSEAIFARTKPTERCFAGTSRPVHFRTVCMAKTPFDKHSDNNDSAAERISAFDEVRASFRNRTNRSQESTQDETQR